MPLLPYSELPFEHPGTPDVRTPGKFLRWLGWQQRWYIAAGVFFGITWMLAQALLWSAVGAAIDHGLNHHDQSSLVRWSVIVLGLGVVQAVSGAIRHQLAVTNWMMASYRSIQLVGRHLTNVGTAATDEIPSGDIVGTVAMDAMRIGGAFDVIPRFIGAIVSWVVVSIILLSQSVTLGLVVLIGVPLLASLTKPLMKPLHERQRAQREVAGKLAALGSDTVAGLRILRGVGGEDVFLENYVGVSRQVEHAGVEVSKPQSALESGQLLLPAILTTIVTYIGAHEVLSGRLQAGQLVAFFGYATFLTTPLRTAIEYVIAGTRALVGARKVLAILAIEPRVIAPKQPLAWPSHVTALRDEHSGLELRRGVLAALVTESPAEAAAVADRLGWFVANPDGVTVDGRPLADYAPADVRPHVVVSEIEPRLFTGSLREELNPHGKATDESILAALNTSSALDVLEALSDGLDTHVEERGRSFSGGQRQRLALARALALESDVLILVEPTSAVDTHTEGRIARNLRSAREGRTTLIATTSPLLLEKMDTVFVLRDGKVIYSGSHEELLLNEATYRNLVLRGDE